MSKITLKAGEIVRVMKTIGAAIEYRSENPILTCVLIEEGGVFTGTDLDWMISAQAKAQESEGDLCICARSITELARGLPPSFPVTIHQEDEGARFTFGRSEYQIPAQKPDEFAKVQFGDQGCRLLDRDSGISEAISRVKHAISREATRYYLNGVWLGQSEPGADVVAVATDGHRLSLLPLPFTGQEGVEFPAEGGIIIPRVVCEKMAKLGDPQELLYDGKNIKALYGRTTITSKLIDGKYPDYQRVIPKAELHTATVTLPLQATVKALDRLININPRGGISFAKINGQESIAMLDALEHVPGCRAMRPDEIPENRGVDPRYLRSLLESARMEEVDLVFSGVDSPIKHEGRGGFTSLIMPYKI